jgi:WD40 repeat protein
MRSIGIVISSGRSIYIFDAEVGKSLVCIDDTVNPPSAQTSCSLCVSNPPPDSMMGPLIVMGTHDGRVIVRDLLSSGVLFDEISKVKLFSAPVRAVAIHDNPHCRHAKKTSKNSNSMFEQKHKSMILAGCGNEVHVWTTEGGVDKVAVFTDHEHPVNAISLCFRPQRTSFADHHPTTTSTSRPSTSTSRGDRNGSESSDHTSYIVTAASDARILVYNMKTFTLCRTLTGHEGGVLCLSTLGMKVSRIQHHSRPSSESQSRSPSPSPIEHDSLEVGALRSHDNDDNEDTQKPTLREEVVMYAVSGGFDKTVRVWDLDTGDLLKTLRGHSGPVNCVACIPSRRPAIISGGVEGSIVIWCLETGAQLGKIESAHSEQVKSVSVTLRPRLLIVSGGYDGKTKVWDLSMSDDAQLRGIADQLNPKKIEKAVIEKEEKDEGRAGGASAESKAVLE